jgi:phosphoglucosamine mutase
LIHYGGSSASRRILSMKLFGTDGIRGLTNSENMNPELALRMGQALVLYCKKRSLPLKIIIARDTRDSGQMLEDALIAGIISMGADAVLARVLPTPGLAFLVREEKAGAGIVISASHNDNSYNGLKPFKEDGTKLSDEEETEIEKYIQDKKIERKTGKDFKPGEKIILTDAKEKYIDFFLAKLPAEAKRANFKLVLDCAHGSTYEIAPAVFEKIVKEIDCLFSKPDGKNINDNCGSQYVESIQKEVVGKGADLGLAFDGDGDRLIAIDEKGNGLTGDQIIYIIAKMLKEKGELNNDFVITTVMSNLGFVASLKKLGIQHIATSVGDRQVFFEMGKRGAVLGGEESGHIIYTGFHAAGDGIVGGIMLLAAMNYFGRPLSDLAAELTLFPKILVNIEVTDKPEIGTVPEISSVIKEIENKLGGEGRVLVRYSGTENLCRVMVEGRDEKEIKKYAQDIADNVKKYLG